jgi:signal transduction histidine kinase
MDSPGQPAADRLASMADGSGLFPPREAQRSADLLTLVAWFNRLRLRAAVGVIVMTAAGSLLGVVDDTLPLYGLGVLIGVLDWIYIRSFRALASRPARRVRRHVELQIALDLVILTALLHFAGGVTNPLALFYLFHAFLAALLLSIRAAVIVAAASLALVTLLGISERVGWLAHRPFGLGLMNLREASPLTMAFFLLVFALTLGFSIYFVARVLGRLRRREDELMHLHRQLGHSEKLVSVGTLAAGVSHEINNPVGVIQNKVQILRYRIADGDAPEDLLAELETIEKHARRIGSVTEGLLTFSRETPFAPGPVDLNGLVREGLDLVAVRYERAAVELKMELSDHSATVTGSTNHLLQVLVNILLNAVDASAPGSCVTVTTGTVENMGEVQIRDRGSGIEPAHLDKIFDPFFTTKDVDRGTGLGLSITHGIVERHGGSILVESEPGAGSTFRVRIPLE